ncbi:MAG: hypothetical protein ACO2ON_03775 [Candidatus Nanopusillus sp.]
MDIKEVKEKWKNKVKKALFLLFLATPTPLFVTFSLLNLYFEKPIDELYISLIFAFILSIIGFIGTIMMMIYLPDLINEEYECMLKREKCTKDMTLSDKILSAIILSIIIAPIMIIFFLDYFPVSTETKIAIGIASVMFLFGTFYIILKIASRIHKENE